MPEISYPNSLASLFNRHHTIGKDLAIDPDPDLRSYQDDINYSGTASRAMADERSDDNDIAG